MISVCLKKNTTIVGFHFEGNHGYVDCHGFLCFNENDKFDVNVN